MRREDLPSGTAKCPVCRGRGSNFDRARLTLDPCTTCEGTGWVLEHEELDAEIKKILPMGE